QRVFVVGSVYGDRADRLPIRVLVRGVVSGREEEHLIAVEERCEADRQLQGKRVAGGSEGTARAVDGAATVGCRSVRGQSEAARKRPAGVAGVVHEENASGGGAGRNEGKEATLAAIDRAIQ